MIRRKQSLPLALTAAVAMAAALAVESAVAPAAAGEGIIEATIVADVEVEKVYAIERRPTRTGVEMHRTEGRISDGRLRITNLPTDAIFDLRFETPRGVIEGWDAVNLPRSDYVEEQPLSEESRKEIFDKIANMARRGFFDEVEVLDIQGNIQNAAVLLRQVRTRPFVGGGYRRGERVHRVDRQQWEDPEEHTWQPHRDLPWYAIERLRLMPDEFDNLSRVYARHLGGIKLTPRQPRADLGRLRLPTPEGGVYAVDPENRRIAPVRLKPDPGDGAEGDSREQSEQATSPRALEQDADSMPTQGDSP